MRGTKALSIVSIFLVLLFYSPSKVYGWGSYTHREMVFEALRDTAAEWKLTKPIPITSFQQFLEKFSTRYPEVKTKEDFAKWLRINPNANFEIPERREQIKRWMQPLQILALYAPRTDDSRDSDIPYDTLEQFWFGAGQGGNSQAFRHMEKPAFDPLHPFNTGGFPLGTIGQASERAQIYFDVAVLAYQLNEPYWAWNFLGCGLHYIQDLSNPFHSAQLLSPIIWHGWSAYWRWGREQDWNLLQTFQHIATNTHHYFEGYMDHQLFRSLENKESFSEGKRWREVLQGTEALPFKSALQIAKYIRNFSSRFAFDAIHTTLVLTEDKLLQFRKYIIADNIYDQPEDPMLYMTSSAEAKILGQERFSKMMRVLMKEEGKALRSVIHLFLETVSQ